MAQYDQSKNGTFLCVDGNGRIDDKKTGAIPSRYYKGAEAYGSSPFIRESKVNRIKNINPSGNGMNGNVYGTNAKSPTITTNKGEGSKISNDNGATYRKLTPLECERLQTLPDNYTLVLNENGKQLVSNSQRYKMIGNGWTIEAVSHILKHLP